MSVLDELDNILSSIGLGVGKKKHKALELTLADLNPMDVEKLDWSAVQYTQPDDMDLTKTQKLPSAFLPYVLKQDPANLSEVLVALMMPVLMEKLASIPERHYPSAKLLLCDKVTLFFLNKLKQYLSIKANAENETSIRNFIYRPPFNVTAVLPLADLVDMIIKFKEPIVYFNSQTGKVTNHNYAIAKRIIPYLKVVDLVVSLSDPRGLDLTVSQLADSNEHQVLQYLAHFARTKSLMDLKSICKQTGLPHPHYENVTISPLVASGKALGQDMGSYVKPSIQNLTIVAELAVQLASRLNLRLTSIHYRAGDPNGYTQICSTIISTIYRTSYKLPSRLNDLDTRILIVDRTYDLQNLLYHSDTYGSYVEQEYQLFKSDFAEWSDLDPLGDKLQQVPLTDVLGAALRASLEIQTNNSNAKSKANATKSHLLSAAMATSNSLRQHLTIIRSIYTTLNEGYLVTLKLESSLEESADQLRALKSPLSGEEQQQFVGKIQRIGAALIQLSKISGKSVKTVDIARIACILIDLINTFTSIPGTARQHERVLANLKSTLLLEESSKSELRESIEAKLVDINRSKEDKAAKLKDLNKKLMAFDKLSMDNRSCKSVLKLEEIIDKFSLRNLDHNSYPAIALESGRPSGQAASSTTGIAISNRISMILIFLGALTPRELAKLKDFESKKIAETRGRILMILSGLCKPENFLMIQAKGCVKNYHWGKIGDDSFIAQFEKHNANEIEDGHKTINGTTNGQMTTVAKLPKAELWFGSHPSGPATLIVGDDQIRLNEFLAKEPEMVGVVGHYFKYNKQLPFLFKILSIAEPLSLQAHPDMKLASILHKRDPNNYPDANHKPELAIALTEFEVLCDFRPHREILNYMKTVPMFKNVVGEENYNRYLASVEQNQPADKQRAALGECFKRLMIQDKDTIANEIKHFLLDPQYCTVIDKNLFKLIVKLYKLYPGDPGVFAPLFLNYLKLSPGQAVYLKANKLHAYIQGECIECMACSDNVVRAGLTTKFRDIQTLINMLDYEPIGNAYDVLLKPIKYRDDLMVESFAPTDEFKVDKVVINCKETLHDGDYVLPSKLSGSFFIVLSGKATAVDFFNLRLIHKLSAGSAGYIPPKISLKLHDIKVPLTIYRAYC